MRRGVARRHAELPDAGRAPTPAYAGVGIGVKAVGVKAVRESAHHEGTKGTKERVIARRRRGAEEMAMRRVVGIVAGVAAAAVTGDGVLDVVARMGSGFWFLVLGSWFLVRGWRRVRRSRFTVGV